jgi:hypothetical protein
MRENTRGYRRKTVNLHVELVSDAGQWLSVLPSTVNGTELSAQEFRDALLLRYARCPPDLPIQCNGCQQKFSVRHALECKRGGLVISRHNEIRDELSDLASKAFSNPHQSRFGAKIKPWEANEPSCQAPLPKQSHGRPWRHLGLRPLGSRD